MAHDITSEADLVALYGAIPKPALTKEATALTPSYRAFIEASPLLVLATSGPGGLDCSPRGDPAGFVRISDDKTLLIPDRRGNNRLDSLKNIISDPRVALIFFAPRANETVRVNGHAVVSADPELCASFAIADKQPATVVRVTIDAVYFQCGKALIRSALWQPERWPAKSPVPTAGQMLRDTDATFAGEAYDAAAPERIKATLY